MGITVRILHFFLKIFTFAINIAVSFFFYKEPVTLTSRTRSREPPLHTCAISVISSTHRAYRTAQELDGPLGSLFRKSAWFTASVEPYTGEIKNWFLAILTLADNRITAAERTVERHIPASALVFDRVDGLVRAAKTFPEKAERIVAILLALVDKVPLLNGALSYVVSWLDSWLGESDLEIAAPEKDIPMDSRSARSSAGYDEEAGRELFSPAQHLKKEVLVDKGNKEDNLQGQEPEVEEEVAEEEVVGDGTEQGLIDDASILDLFESGWHMNKPVKRARGSPTAMV